MADTTKFNHDNIGHILSENLLEVPEFQRPYSWQVDNVKEFLADLEIARQSNAPYFIGTLVFVDNNGSRSQIVDGQQRLATTAILLIAVRDRLRELNKEQLAQKLQEKFLRRYVLSQEEEVVSLHLSTRDQDSYDALLEGELESVADDDPILMTYRACTDALKKIAPKARDYKKLIAVSEQLERQVQVLTAVASDVAEAYVIFETLNDRGADLTTADLLKNFLFSSAKANSKYVQQSWVELEATFRNRPGDLVKFVRHEYISRNGPTQSRKLYRAIQEDVKNTSGGAKTYVRRLKSAAKIYAAIKDPDSAYWSGNSVETRDALLAYRRFGFESSMPLVLAVFARMKKPAASKALVKITGWSVRAQFAGRLGAAQAEQAFGRAAKEVTEKTATTQAHIRTLLAEIIPTDAEFKRTFSEYGKIAPSRAKYLLAMLEGAYVSSQGKTPPAHDWSSRRVTIEHIMAKSTKGGSEEVINSLGNYALLQLNTNKGLEDKAFAEKVKAYEDSEFELTQIVAQADDWGPDDIAARAKQLANLATAAWPAQ